MKDELIKFENRSDDWLAKQRAYEERVSAWDLDEAKRIKVEHAKRHAAYNKMMQNTGSQFKEISNFNIKQRKLFLIWYMIIFIIVIISFILQL